MLSLSNALLQGGRFSAAITVVAASLHSVRPVNAAGTVTASDEVTVRRDNTNYNASNAGLLFIKNQIGAGSASGNAIGYVKFNVDKSTYVNGFQQALLSVAPEDPYFIQTVGGSAGVAGATTYLPDQTFRVYGLRDTNVNENFTETTLVGSTASTTVPNAVAAINVSSGAATNNFTPNPAGTINDLVDLGTFTVSDPNKGTTDNLTWTYGAGNNIVVTSDQPGPDGIPDASNADPTGSAPVAQVDVADLLNNVDANGIATFAIFRVTEGDGGAFFFSSSEAGAGGAPKLTLSDGITGDVNRDGSVDFLDIDPFRTSLLQGQPALVTALPSSNYLASDINRDGSIDFLDIDPFKDLVLGGPQSLSESQLAALESLSAVPEPTGLALLGTAAVATLGRRRRR